MIRAFWAVGKKTPRGAAHGRRFHSVSPLRNREHPNPPKIPAKLVWDVPIEAVEASVPIELKGLPLP